MISGVAKVIIYRFITPLHYVCQKGGNRVWVVCGWWDFKFCGWKEKKIHEYCNEDILIYKAK